MPENDKDFTLGEAKREIKDAWDSINQIKDKLVVLSNTQSSISSDISNMRSMLEMIVRNNNTERIAILETNFAAHNKEFEVFKETAKNLCATEHSTIEEALNNPCNNCQHRDILSFIRIFRYVSWVVGGAASIHIAQVIWNIAPYFTKPAGP